MKSPSLLVIGSCSLLLAARAVAQITESPSTVAPGRSLLEMDVASLSRDEMVGERVTTLGLASTFISTGVTPSVDVQVGAQFFLTRKREANGVKERHRGAGDFYLRAKWRIYGDAERGAVAVLPYIKFPTNSGGIGNEAIEGGLIFPWAKPLASGGELAAMVGADLLHDDGDGHETYCYATFAVSRPVSRTLGVYAEGVVARFLGAAGFANTVGAGLTIAASDRATWDVAVYRGVSAAASDWDHVLRFTFQF